ncbi:AI-2E family transporter [Candidatus Solirubrobacter pratensis]|uniref:AI-2E family transporter n=1 Tax=Candidatus Solirubrobacter pratensis TaxID=1298857 RepID=UPI000481FC84|nr:AI-2E family transporter [Candidatus Solirubrobacter pratensis]
MTKTEPSRPEEDHQIRSDELTGVFAVRAWIFDLGVTSWLLVGITLLAVAVVWLLSLTHAIVFPVVTAAILASVLSPVIGAMQRRGLPRSAAAAIVLLGAIALAVLLTVVILAGIGSQSAELRDDLHAAAGTLRGWLQDAGVDADHAARAQADGSTAVGDAFHTLLTGLAGGLGALASLAVFLSFTALSLFFLLKDGPLIRAWTERHMGVPRSVAHAITGRTLQSLRGYFAGVTAVAVFNGVVIGLSAVVLGVPRAGSIAIVNFVTAYIPYLGAWSAGAFTVLIALGSKGSGTALAMAVISLLANGALQQLIQPLAYGAALDMHPLGILIVTIAAGSLFGAIGLILAAPLTSAALRVSADVARARAPDQPVATGRGAEVAAGGP